MLFSLYKSIASEFFWLVLLFQKIVKYHRSLVLLFQMHVILVQMKEKFAKLLKFGKLEEVILAKLKN